MKWKILLACLSIPIFGFQSAAQSKLDSVRPFLSTEIFGNLPFPGALGMNYGFGSNFIINYKPFKISTGIFYNRIVHLPKGDYGYEISYLNVPVIMVHIRVLSLDNFYFFAGTGLMATIPFNYKYPQFQNYSYLHHNVQYGGYVVFPIQLELIRKINKRWAALMQVYTFYQKGDDVSDEVNTNGAGPSYEQTLVHGGLRFGINFGLEWRLKSTPTNS